MKAKVSVSALSEILELVKRIPSEKTTIPQCEGLLLEFLDSNVLKIHANNTRQWALATMDKGVTVEEAGEIVVPAKRFAGWVKSFSEGEIKFKADSSQSLALNLSVGRARTKIKCYSAGDFPEVPTKAVTDSDITFKVTAEEFEKKVHSITWAFKAERDALPTHRSIHMLCRPDGTVQIRAFDGVGSLSLVDLAIENPTPIPEGIAVFVPDEVLDALSFVEGDISVAMTEKKIEFIQDKLMGGGLALMGQFPDPTTLLGGIDKLPTVKLPIGSFKSAVGRLDVVVDNAISCIFDISPTDFVLRSQKGLLSSVEEHVPVKTENLPEGANPKIVLSLPYTKSLLSHYTGGELIFKFDKKMVVFADPEVSDDWIGFMAQMVGGS